MKIRNIAVLILGLFIVAGAIWLPRTQKPFDSKKAGNSLSSAATPLQISRTEALALSASPAFVQKPGGPFEPRDPRWKAWNENMKRDPSFQWKTPINFYGKVVDERGQPVQGAVAKIGGTDISPTGSFAETRVSDENGLFSLTGRTGKFLSVEVTKDGYFTSQKENRTGFEFAAFSDPNYYQPDPNNPVVFHLRKKGKAQPLIYRRELRGFLPDGQPSYIDLVTGQKSRGPSETGDLEITISRSANAVKPFDWSVKLAAVGPGSGILESDDEFMFEAPGRGYQQSIQYSQRASDPNWRIETTKRFYVRSRNGQVYARVEATIIPMYQENAAIDWQYYVNDTGSRNLESSDVQPAPAP